MLTGHALVQQAILREDPKLIENEFASRMDAAKRFLSGANDAVHISHTWPQIAAYYRFHCVICFDPLCTERYCCTCKDRLPPSLEGAKEPSWSSEFGAW